MDQSVDVVADKLASSIPVIEQYVKVEADKYVGSIKE